MKKKELNEIIGRWRSEYERNGVSSEKIRICCEYVERLVSRDLPPIMDLTHLSLLIGIDRSLLERMIFGTESFYREFRIPKHTGGTRTINAPYPSLRFVQRWIHKNILSIQKTQFSAHGFVEGHSILTNADRHRQCRMLLKMDLKDFFGSIPMNYIINYFHKELGFNLKVSFFLARICCLGGCLPQGAATSPTLSNLISTSLDRRLYRLAKRFNLVYTRYADDLAFSGEDIPDAFVRYVESIVSECHLNVNRKKTRLYKERGSKIIAGISLATGIPRLPRDYRRQLRQELYYVGRYGLKAHMRHNKIKNPNYLASLQGKVAFWLFVEPDNAFALKMNRILKIMSNNLEYESPDTTTDYKEWIQGLDPNTEEIHAVYTAADTLESSGGVKVIRLTGENYMLSYPSPLGKDLILTEKSHNALLEHIRQKYCGGLDIETWYGFQLNLDK